jgi:zinc protease
MSASMPLIQRKVLKNGTVVIVVESHLAPVVQVNGAIRAGDVFDPSGKKGLSALCTHILNNGPSRPGHPQNMQQQEDLGLQPQAMLKFDSSPETINFQTRCLSRDLAAQLNLVGAAMKDAPLQDADIEKARAEFYSAIKNAEESVMVRINRALLRSVIAPNTSYYPIDPSQKARDVSQLKSADVKDFLSQYITPNSTVVVIAGDVSPDRAFALVEKSFEGWSSVAPGTAARAFPPATESSRKLLKASIPLSATTDKTKTTVSIGRLMNVQSDEKDYSILLISDCALNNHPIFSRLVQRMNSEPGLADSLSYEDMESRFLPLSNMISWSLIVPVEPSLVSRTTAAIQAELKRFTRTGITDNELSEVKRYMSAALPVRLMPSTAEAAKSALNGYFQGTDSNFLGQLIGSIRAVDLDSVNKFIKNEFKPDQGVLIIAGSPEVIKQVRVSSASRTKGGIDSEPAPATP